MANLKAIRRRIKSVQSTQKITKAMKMVAAAKVRRAQARVLAARPFTQRVVKMLREVVRDTAAFDVQDLPLLHRRDVKSVGLLIISSDRGLCGSYNTTIFRKALDRIQALQKEGKEVKLILVGMKAVLFFRNIKVEKLKTYTLLPAIPSVEEAKLIADQAGEMFVNGTVDAVEILGTDFISMLRSEVINTKFLPVEMPPAEEHVALQPEMLFEPTVQEVLQLQLLPKYIENVIYQALLEASASELAARMTAMSNASTNAQDLINSLTLVYNKARQASITQELLEIVGGAEALKG
ncbi:MAG: ATP synthase F1 subunit gamma [Candidatus Obscuribacterales bacterium]|nr:ATP synthase F1 subunit gamma [Candidatus Obscuribacterales bacterium]